MTRLVILVCFLAIVLSLASALVHLVRDKGESKKLARALTIRVGLSVLLFLFLIAAWLLGWIPPRGT